MKRTKSYVALVLSVIMMALSAMPVQAAPFAQPEAVRPVMSEAGRTGWQTVAGRKYYYQNGILQTGKVQVGKKWYYFGPEMKKGLIRDEKKPGTFYYADSKGVLQTGWKTINGKKYYFWCQSIHGHVHHEAATGIWSVNGKMYLFDDEGAVLTGLNLVDGKLYYADSKGALQTGWKTVGGKRYYFWSGNKPGHVKYEAAYGIRTIGGIWHLFSKEGCLLTGLNSVDGKTYFTDGSGRIQKGWKTIGGRTYFFDSGTFAALTGTQILGGTTYLFDENGALVKGEGPVQEAPSQPAEGHDVFVADDLFQVVKDSGRCRVVEGVNTCKGVVTYYGYDQHKQGDRPLNCSGCGMCSFLTIISTFRQKKPLDAPAYRKNQLKKLIGTSKCPISIYAGKKMVKSAGMTAQWVTAIGSNDEVVADISSHLKKGMPVVISLRYFDRRGKVTRRYTNQNHYALLVGITKDGKNAFLMDSGGKGCRYVDLEDICWHIPAANRDAEKVGKLLWDGWCNSGGYMKVFL